MESNLVVFAPHNADCVGTFDVITDTFACIDITTFIGMNEKFIGAATHPESGLVVFAPHQADCVGTFDANSNTFDCIDISTHPLTRPQFNAGGIRKFHGAVAHPVTGLVYFAPERLTCIGTFNASSGTFGCIQISNTFRYYSSPIVHPNTGNIIFLPAKGTSNDYTIDAFDVISNNINTGNLILKRNDHNDKISSERFVGTAVHPSSDLVVFAPANQQCIGTYDKDSNYENRKCEDFLGY